MQEKEVLQQSQGQQKIIQKYILEELQKEADSVLLSDLGKELRKQRSAQAEDVFGVLKEDKKFERFNRRGQENVETEIYLIEIGHNV